MTILYLISYAGRAGTEKYVLELMRAFAARGHDCRLAYREAGGLSDTARREGFPTVQMDLSAGNTLFAAAELRAYCRANRVDVIHTQYPRENVIAVLSRLFRPGTRVVFTYHLTIPPGRKWRFLWRLISPGNTALIAVCETGASILKRIGIDPAKIHMIPNGVESGPPYLRQNVIRREHGLGRDCFIFLTLARFAPEKGLDVLIKAVSLLRERTERPFVCVIAGEGHLFPQIKEQITALGLEDVVLCPGYRRDTRSLLCSSDGYISSSISAEAMSFSILEAMRCSLPLVVTDVGAGRELASGCGYAVPPGDARALADAMYALLIRTDIADLGKRSYEKAVGEYSLGKMTDAILLSYITQKK